MSKAQFYIGVDVAKDHIDVYDPRTGRCSIIAMKPRALNRFAKQTARDDVIVVFEATGGYDRPLAIGLSQANAKFHRVNPARARKFAEAVGCIAKTDQVDARMLSEMGDRLELKPVEPKSLERQRLAALLTRRNQLVETRKRERTQVHQADFADIEANHRKNIRSLSEQIKQYDKLIRECIADSPQLADLAKIVRSVPGNGPVTVATYLAQMPELGKVDRRAIAALGGVAPMANDSGKRKGQRKIKGGRREVRRVLYIAGRAAVGCIPAMQAFKEKLMIEQQLEYKQAIIAVARRMLVITNALVRDGKTYQMNHT
jgi:transposase